MRHALQAAIQEDLTQPRAFSYRKEGLAELTAGLLVCALDVGFIRGHNGTLLPFRWHIPRRLTERAYKGPSRGEKRVLLSCYFGPSKANSSLFDTIVSCPCYPHRRGCKRW